MSRTLTEGVVSTRNARAKLRPGIHWRGIDADVHLGYRKGSRGGRWLVRWYVGRQKYQQETIGSADDAVEADGVTCLTFEQARAAAARLVAQKRADAIADAEGPAPTIRSAVEAYVEARDARERARSGTRRDARLRLTRHVLADQKLADTKLHTLTEQHLLNWRNGLPASLAASTVRRITNDFKAALNAAAVENRARLPAEVFVVIKNGLAARENSAPVARDKQALSDPEIRSIIDAAQAVDAEDGWEGDLFRMVVVLAATGARFSQITRMTVADVQPQHGRLMVPVSHKGRGTKKVSHVAIRVGQDVLTALQPVSVGRRGRDVLLERWRHKQVHGTDGRPPQWVRDERGPWLNAAELTRPWKAIIEAAGLPTDIVPYALRHSSIVRQLRSGLPVRLVAALHDTSTAMIEKHYAAAIIDALDALSAGAIIPLVAEGNGNVVPLRAPNE